MSRSLVSILSERHGQRPTSRERREFVKASLGVAAGLLAGCSLPKRKVSGRQRVVVVGAGFAGLACAHELLAAGYDVTVLESRARVGGRVLSFAPGLAPEFIFGKTIEGGAELVGSNHPIWLGYAERFGIEWLDVAEDPEQARLPVRIGNTVLAAAEAAALWRDMLAALTEMNALARDIPEDEPWRAAQARELDARSVAAWIDSLDAPPLVKRAIWINQTSDNGQLAEQQSLLGQLAAVKGGGCERFWTETEVFRSKGGNQQLAVELARSIGSARVRLGTPVVAIERWNGRLRVRTRDDWVECDDVVLAVAPSVWGKIDLHDAIPRALAPQLGSNTKYLARVRARFWRELSPPRSQYALSDGLVQQTWDATQGQGDGGDACLTGFSGGPSADLLLAMTPEVRRGAVEAEYEAHYPGFADHRVDARFMNWPRDPWTMCSYSFPAPGEVTRLGPLLQEPLLDGRLHLAGEHCCSKFVGYMEGALQSGVRTAHRLARRDGLRPD